MPSLHDYTVGVLLGFGSYAHVYKATHVITGNGVALKIIDKRKLLDVGEFCVSSDDDDNGDNDVDVLRRHAAASAARSAAALSPATSAYCALVGVFRGRQEHLSCVGARRVWQFEELHGQDYQTAFDGSRDARARAPGALLDTRCTYDCISFYRLSKRWLTYTAMALDIGICRHQMFS